MTAVKEQLKASVSPLPFVLPHEIPAAKKLIDDDFIRLTGKPFDFRPAGYMVAVKIWIRPDEMKTITIKEGPDKGKKATLWMPPAMQREDKYQSVAALVCALGPQAYKGENRDGTPRFPEGPWCTPASFVLIPRYESFLFTFRGVAMALIPDDKIMGVIESPEDVAPISVADKV